MKRSKKEYRDREWDNKWQNKKTSFKSYSLITSKQIELESPPTYHIEEIFKTFLRLVYFFHISSILSQNIIRNMKHEKNGSDRECIEMKVKVVTGVRTPLDPRRRQMRYRVSQKK